MSHVYTMPWQVGAHTGFKGKIFDTLKTAIGYGMYTVQFYMGSSQSYARTIVSLDDISNSMALVKRYPLNVFSHYPLITNLAGSKEVLGWTGDGRIDGMLKTTIKNLEYELSVLSNFPVNGVVVHPGNHNHTKKGIEAICKTINKINFPDNSRLLLENTAGGGTSLARTLSEIKEILDGVDEKKRDNVGVCIDTAHLFAYGDYDISKKEIVQKFFDDFEEIIGLPKLWLIHLNDSKIPLKKRVDRHALLKTGYIWGESDESLLTLLNLAEKNNIPLVLETHGLDMLTLACIGKEAGLD